ncbi:hypothetical protein SBOR_2681 [Sclerotinia borealis F-4128]|uniref:Uncharacterized protein n=1 Tax=Sclerotinia borealis (strain F-4128) TaxID=1432307 RepID=W9CM95_SCLBF|nr:hypothetical protein SBOR_2681 [Sclerotinia borealis F-4128]
MKAITSTFASILCALCFSTSSTTMNMEDPIEMVSLSRRGPNPSTTAETEEPIEMVSLPLRGPTPSTTPSTTLSTTAETTNRNERSSPYVGFRTEDVKRLKKNTASSGLEVTRGIKRKLRWAHKRPERTWTSENSLEKAAGHWEKSRARERDREAIKRQGFVRKELGQRLFMMEKARAAKEQRKPG